MKKWTSSNALGGLCLKKNTHKPASGALTESRKNENFDN